jgi:hypothetical protein
MPQIGGGDRGTRPECVHNPLTSDYSMRPAQLGAPHGVDQAPGEAGGRRPIAAAGGESSLAPRLASSSAQLGSVTPFHDQAP